MLKKYDLKFNLDALILTIILIIPTIIWSIFPTSNDILRAESITPIVDLLARVFQISLIASLCALRRKDVNKLKLNLLILFTIISTVIYYISWAFYFQGHATNLMILAQTLCPCLSFAFYSVDRKNRIAIILSILFAICHLIFAIFNFMI